MTSHVGNFITALCQRGSFTYTDVVVVAGWWQASDYPGSEGALNFSPVLSALSSSMSGCPFKVGPVGLTPTKTLMVVGPPRSQLTSRASTLALYETIQVSTQEHAKLGQALPNEKSLKFRDFWLKVNI
jgi:hypothetical protein